MFTGIIEEVGTLEKIERITDGYRIKVNASLITEDLHVNDSVAVNGVCLTVIKTEQNGFWVEAVGTTLEKTTIKKIKQNSHVNLERAVRLSDRLGGHLVQGHVNGIGIIKKILKIAENYFVEVEIPGELEKYVLPEGSIAVDGISLTIAKLSDNLIGLSIIPHTWMHTNLQHKKVSDEVNIETDVIAKYVEKLLGTKNSEKNLTDTLLKEMGY
ncbi:MAG: riboflavin synthase [Ignavibacteriales bacterium]|nr:riboflavin synthase [Ignavibacteriales bacterium]